MSTFDRRKFFQAVGTGMSAGALLPAAGTAYPDRKALVMARQAKGIVAPNKTYRMMEWECHTPPEAIVAYASAISSGETPIVRPPSVSAG